MFLLNLLHPVLIAYIYIYWKKLQNSMLFLEQNSKLAISHQHTNNRIYNLIYRVKGT